MTGILPNSGVGPSSGENSLPSPDLGPGCENLWYSTQRCTPRFDPAAQNAIISEMLNLVMCGGNVYDCSRLDNLCTSVKDLIKDVLHDCQDRAYPDASAACKIEQLVLATDANGCIKIARYSQNLTVGKLSGYALFGPSASAILPTAPGNAATFYDVSSLSNDAANNTVNMSKVSPNRVMYGVVTLGCAATIELDVSAQAIFQPGANGGNGARSRLCAMIDGVVVYGPGGIYAGVSWTNYNATVEGKITIPLTAGAHIIQLFVIAETYGLPPAQIGITTGPSFGVGESGGAFARIKIA